MLCYKHIIKPHDCTTEGAQLIEFYVLWLELGLVKGFPARLMDEVDGCNIARAAFAVGGKSRNGGNSLFVLIDEPGVPTPCPRDTGTNNVAIKAGRPSPGDRRLGHPRPVGFIAKDDTIPINQLAIPIDIAFKPTPLIVGLTTNHHRLRYW